MFDALRPGGVGVPPYFDHLIERFNRGEDGRRVHLGYWEREEMQPRGEADDEFARAQARLDDLLLEMARLRDGDAAIDIGCGFGGTLDAINRRRARMRLVGINVDPRQLEICRGLTAARGNRLAWCLADGCRLPFADASFDCVLCIEAMFHFPSRRRFFGEAARVLRPGGTLVGSDIIVSPAARRFDTPAFPIAAVLQDGFGPWPDFWGDDADHTRLAEAAGLRGEVRDVSDNVRPSHRFTAPSNVDIQASGQDAALGSALRLRWLHEQGHLRYVCFRFEPHPDRASPR